MWGRGLGDGQTIRTAIHTVSKTVSVNRILGD